MVLILKEVLETAKSTATMEFQFTQMDLTTEVISRVIFAKEMVYFATQSTILGIRVIGKIIGPMVSDQKLTEMEAGTMENSRMD